MRPHCCSQSLRIQHRGIAAIFHMNRRALRRSNNRHGLADPIAIQPRPASDRSYPGLPMDDHIESTRNKRGGDAINADCDTCLFRHLLPSQICDGVVARERAVASGWMRGDTGRARPNDETREMPRSEIPQLRRDPRRGCVPRRGAQAPAIGWGDARRAQRRRRPPSGYAASGWL